MAAKTGKKQKAGTGKIAEPAVAAPIAEDARAEIDELRSSRAMTRRATVAAMEEMLYQPIPVLDHGFIRVIDYLGDDGAVVQAARVSYGRGTRKVSDDRNLIRYLMRHRHSTPFEMCEIKLHVKLPIFVARQWIRHRTANVNEYSARYSILDREFYLPDRGPIDALSGNPPRPSKADRLRKEGQADLLDTKALVPEGKSHLAAQSTDNRQGRGPVLEGDERMDVLRAIHRESARAYTNYMHLLNEDTDGGAIDPERQGLARGLARMVLPVNYYTQWYWKNDLYNLLHFLSLRADAHAQYEIRAYAEKMCEIVEKWVPLVWEAFLDYRLTGAPLSGPALKVIKRLIAGEDVAQEGSGLSKREWRELMDTLGRKA